MYNIDFQKLQHNTTTNRIAHQHITKRAPSRYIFILSTVLLVTFIVGMVSGLYVNKHSIPQEVTTHNLSPTPIEQASIPQIDTHKETYLIWVKTGKDKKQIYQQGLFLKKQELPVFLSKSGDKFKIYVGPLYGTDEAYSTLAFVKQYPLFRGSILHKRR